jgi:hypothetical protein
MRCPFLHGKYLHGGRARQILAALSAAKYGDCLVLVLLSLSRCPRYGHNTGVSAVPMRIRGAGPVVNARMLLATVLPLGLIRRERDGRA